jgi:hypothetical protein
MAVDVAVVMYLRFIDLNDFTQSLCFAIVLLGGGSPVLVGSSWQTQSYQLGGPPPLQMCER